MSENYFLHNGSYISDIYSLESYLKTNLVAGINNEAECALNNFEVNDENLQFIFGIDGVETVGYSLSGNVRYFRTGSFLFPRHSMTECIMR